MENLLKKIHLSPFYSILFGLTAVAITGCNLDDDPDPDPDPIAVSYVSLYHASPDAPPVDILMENNRINFYPLRYSDYTGYLNFYSGERNMRVSPTDASNVVIDTTFTFVEGEAYSLFYINQFNNIKALLVDDEHVLPEEGTSAIRFIHLSPDLPDVDFIRTVEGNSTGIAENTSHLQASEFITVESGIQSFQVRSVENDDVLLSIPDVNLHPEKVYTIVSRGFNTPPAGNNNNLSAQILVNN